MMLGEIVVLVYSDALGAGRRIAGALSSSTFNQTTVKDSLSLDSYGASGTKIPLEIWNFSRVEASPLISLVFLSQESPQGMNSCVAHELLKFIMTNAPVNAPAFAIFVPAASVFSNSLQNGRQAQVLILNDDLGSRTQMFQELATVPGEMQIKDEFLACLLHFLRVTKLPAVLLLVHFYCLSPVDSREIEKEKRTVLEATCELGSLLALWLGLDFSKEKMDMDLHDSSLSRLKERTQLYL